MVPGILVFKGFRKVWIFMILVRESKVIKLEASKDFSFPHRHATAPRVRDKGGERGRSPYSPSPFKKFSAVGKLDPATLNTQLISAITLRQ